MKLEHSHAIPPGASLIERIQEKLDAEISLGDPNRAEGIAVALAILRSSSPEHEIELSISRTGLDEDEEES